MKFIIFFFLINSLQASVLEDVRNLFPKINSMEEAEFQMKLLENKNDPASKAYYAAMFFMKAKYVKFPMSKYNYFKKGKSALDQLIQENKSNIEMRYLRFVFQSELPNFLNYHSNIEEDFSTIVKGLENSDLKREFKLKILNNMLLVKNITKNQTTQIKLLTSKI